MKTFVTGLCFSLIGTSTFAQDFTLKQAQDYAVENYHSSVNADLDIAKSKKKIWETTAIGLPQITGSGSYRYAADLEFDFGSTIPPGQDFIAIFAADNITQGKLEATQLIFDGSYIVGVQAAKTYLELSKNQKIKTDAQVRASVASAYYLALVAEENVEILKQSFGNLEVSLKETRALVEQGFLEDTELDQLELLSSNLQNSLESAELSKTVSTQMLKLNLGLELSDTLNLKDSLQGIIDLISLDALIAQKFDLANNPDMKVLNTQRDLLKLDLRRYKMERLPSLVAFYQYTNTAYQFEFDWLKDATWYDAQNIGINLSVPIFSSGMQGAKIKQASLELQKMDNTVSYFENAMNIQFSNAINELTTKHNAYVNAKKSWEIAQKIYDRTVIKHKEGMSSSFELTQMKNQLLQSQGGYVSALFDLLNSKAKLDQLQNKI